MGVPETSDDVAGTGSNELSMTTEKTRGLLLIYILWGYLRKARARQVVAHADKPRLTIEKNCMAFFLYIFYGVT